MCRLGGIAPELADDAEMAELLIPILRADVTVNERYRPDPGSTALSCPVRCYHGAGDALVAEERLTGWAGTSTGPVTFHYRPGGHFHLFTDPAELVSDVLSLFADLGTE